MDKLEISDLDKQNEERLAKLMQGFHGRPVQFPPGMFDSVRTIAYLEHIMHTLGVREKAHADASERIAEILTKTESEVRRAVLTEGVGNGQSPSS